MFTKEELKAFGLTDEVVEQVLKSQKEKMQNYVLKSELETEKQKVKDRDETIKQLKTFEGDAKDLKDKVEKLTKDLKDKDEKYKTEMDKTKKENAIKMGVLTYEKKFHDNDMVVGMIDKEKITIDENGKISGLKEQLDELQKNKPFMVKQEENNNNNDNGSFGNFFRGRKPEDGNKEKPKTEAEKSAAFGKMFAAEKLRSLGIETED